MAALEDQEHMEKVVENNKRGRDYFYSEFEKMGLEYIPTQANYIFVNVEEEEKELFQKLLRKGVIVRGGFGYPTWIRITIGTPDQNKTLLAALKEVKK